MESALAKENRLTRAEILSAVDYEIASIEKDQASAGWTKWTFFGGFAGLVWGAITEASKNQFTPLNAILVLVGCSTLVDIIEFFVTIFKPESANPNLTNRFKLSSQEFLGSRLSMVATGIRLSALLAGYYFLHNSAIHYRSSWFQWFYVVLLAILIIGIVLSYIGSPMNVRKPIPVWGKCLLYTLVLFPLCMATYQAFRETLFIQPSLTVSDFRLGLIGTVLLWLIPVYLSHVAQHQPLLQTLKGIRRDLAFDRIDVNSARQQADIALDGMLVEDYFQSDLQKILARVDSISKSMHELQNRIREAQSLVQSWESSPPPSNGGAVAPAKILSAILESCDLHRKRILELVKVDDAFSKEYWKKKRSVSRVVSQSEITRMEAKYKAFFEQLKQQGVEIEAQEKSLNECMVRLGQKSPHLLPRVSHKENQPIPSASRG